MTHPQQPKPPYGPQPGPFTAPPPPGHPQYAVPRPLYRMKRVYAGGLFLLMVGTGCGAAMGGDDSTRTAADAKARPVPTVTTTTTATATATVTARPAPTEKATAAAGKTPAAPAVETAALPNFVGMNHQDAQDTAQAAGFYALREKDASGMERLLVLDRNWKVCKQEPAPGKHAVEKTITLHSVKTTESC